MDVEYSTDYGVLFLLCEAICARAKGATLGFGVWFGGRRRGGHDHWRRARPERDGVPRRANLRDASRHTAQPDSRRRQRAFGRAPPLSAQHQSALDCRSRM